MNPILPYFPLSRPVTVAASAREFDDDVFAAHPSLASFVRPLIELEFADAPQALRNALAQPPLRPFRVVVQVTRGTGMFTPRREVLQVQAVAGFDRRRPGVLRDGFLMNNTADRPPERSMSKGELSAMLYAPPART